jgi:hypothetical protein
MNRHRPFPLILAGVVVTAAVAAAGPQDTKTPSPPAIEVRVRVSAGGLFQGDLRLEDFRLLEDGRPQSIESLVLVRGGSVARREGGDAGAPRIERNYTLLFQAVDWDPKLVGAIDYLFASILRPGDDMTLVTPVKPYHLQKDALALKSISELSAGMEEILRKDILRGGGEYRGLINELKRLTRSIGGSRSTFDEDLETDVTMETEGGFSVEIQVERYRQALRKMDVIRLVDEAKLLAFAASLKPVPGQKTVVFFYQREYRPEISQATMNKLMGLYQDKPDLLGNLMELFSFYNRERAFDADRVKRAFADAGIDFHFIFMEKKSQRVFGATMREQSEDIFPGFVEIARATAGTSESSSNPAVTFKRAADASSDYYLVSYRPDRYSSDGGFRTVEVRVGRPGCEVMNGLGYYAK